MDRNRVITGLNDICGFIAGRIGYEQARNFLRTIDDAIVLLKEHEPKQVEAEVINEIDRLYRCPSCHISMILRNQPYCHSCGQAVMWG